MSLNYEKLKKKSDGGSHWTSYSDLFMVLSIVFLFLYVVASVRTGIMSVAAKAQQEKVEEARAQLQEQVSAYDVLKQDYLEKGASSAEKKMYESLMSQMKLLEDEARKEKERLMVQAKMNEEKERGLNQYQNMIKSVITANMLAQSRIKKRDKIIEEKSKIIANKSKAIQKLQKEVTRKERNIKKNNREISKIQRRLEKQIKEVKYAYRSKARSKKRMQAKIAQMRKESSKKIKRLRAQNSKTNQELLAAKKEIEVKEEDLLQKEIDVAGKEYELEQRQNEISSLQQEKTQLKTKISEIQTESAQRMASLKKKFLADVQVEKQRAAQLEQEKTQILGDLERKQNSFQRDMAELRQKQDRERQAQQKAFDVSMKKAKLSSKQRLAKEREFRQKLERQNKVYESQLSDISSDLALTQMEIEQKESEYQSSLGKLQSANKALENEKNRALRTLGQKENDFKSQISGLKKAHGAQMARNQAEFERGLKKAKLGAKARLAKERAHRAEVEAQNAAFNKKLGKLNSELAGTRKAIAAEKSKYKSALTEMNAANRGLSKELARIRKFANARKDLAGRLKKNFKKAGVDADINLRTGEVTIHFGKNYFDYGKATVKRGMESILKQAIPVYAKTIFEDEKIARKISNVEMLGFASPTYRGKYVDPRDLSDGARKAVNYNMDLSYKRAKSIFEYAFNPKKFNYAHQKRLLGLTKVSGQSYLKTRGIASVGNIRASEYCRKYDCNKSQKVIIKFNFDETK